MMVLNFKKEQELSELLNSLRSLHVGPRYPSLQVQTLGLVHLPWIQRLLQIAKIYHHVFKQL